jgi:hypothetical protein
MKKLTLPAFLILLTILSTGCTRPDHSYQVLQAQGYSNISITGYAWFGCSEDDWFKTKFVATGPTGTQVNGVVCSGLFKGSTVRVY